MRPQPWLIALLVNAACLTGMGDAQANDHSQHAHSRFGTLRPRPSQARFIKPAKSHNEAEHSAEMVEVFKRNVQRLRSNKKLDLIFVIDASYSVQLPNFKDEIRFVSRFVSGIPVSVDTTRVAVITFADNAQVWVDQVTADNVHNHKCSLLGTALPAITYASGSTYTRGGLRKASDIINNARPNSKKVVLLITDGKSNGGDPRGLAQRIKRRGVEIFTFGVHSGNVEELTTIASEPKDEHVYILDSFAEFEAVARRALYADAESGNYLTEDPQYCHRYCDTGENCCHSMGACRCGTTTGIYECVCDAGFFGMGRLPDGCLACPAGTYKPYPLPGGPESCTKCPDPNMDSVNGSTSLDNCLCRRGYIRVHNKCEVVRCPSLTAPINGRFEGMECDNRYRSRCGFYCDEGHDLVGSERIKCDISGRWLNVNDDQPAAPVSCQIRHCHALVIPLHASLNCSRDDNAFKTVCRFRCEDGYAYVGSASRYCQANTEWDGQNGECQEIRCAPPNPPAGGSLSVNCQMSGSETLPYGHTCRLLCPSGFALTTSDETRCLQLNRWSTDTTYAKCIDTEQPQIECQQDVEVVAHPQLGNAEVDWVVPEPTDNSGMVSLAAIPSLTPPTTLYIGIFPITYMATDGSGLHSECNFTITVIDTQPPIIGKCENPEPYLVTPGESVARNVRWIEPTFSDNSGSYFVNQSHRFGDMPYGQTKVTYIARDAAGNTRRCVITISVQNNLCPPLENPKYGYKRCQMGRKNLEECELLCNSRRYGMAMQEFGTPFYTCLDNGIWSPADDIPKDCSHQRYSSEITKAFRGGYTMTTRESCNDTQFLESVRINFVEWLTPLVPRLCQQADINLICTLVSVEVLCIQELAPEPEAPSTYNGLGTGTNYYPYGDYNYNWNEQEQARRKRHVKAEGHEKDRHKRSPGGVEPVPPDVGNYAGNDYAEYNPPETQAPTVAAPSVDEPLPDILSLSDKQVAELVPDEGNMLHRLLITVTIRGEVELTNDDDTVESRHVHGQMSEFFGQIDISRAFSGSTPRVVQHVNTSETEYINFDSASSTSTAGELHCPLGAVLREAATCVNCPIGTFYDITNNDCVSCLIGFYQDAEAQLSCKACPEHTSTARIHSRTLEECKPLCKPGSYSSNGVEVCMACPLNTYSDVHGSTECTICPPDTGTTIEGASSFRQCGRLCEPGYASWTGIDPCYPCPLHTYQFQRGQKFCHKCPDGTNTASKASTSYNQCFGILTIMPGTLSDEDVLGMSYVNNTLPFSSCFLDPCQNGGSCEPSGAGYTCTCTPGFTGVDCQIEIDECSSNPCANDGTCIDQINGFTCQCAPGYEGIQCETETNECDEEPCMNGATCVDKLAAFECICADGYTGRLCEVDIDECASSPCQNGGSCYDRVNAFECACAPGYTGFQCEQEIDECLSDPCLHGATCSDLVNAFNCSCPPGFEGDLCEINIDDCVDIQCSNGGTCLDLVNDFRCICAPTFSGPFCETELDPDFDLAFLKTNSYYHVHMRDGIGNLTEVTVAFYMFSNYTESEGTPFSYSIGKGRLADTLTLTNLEALTLYVNGEAMVTDSRKLNDGKWYHVVVTWKSEDGSWVIYLDQAVEASGKGLQTGSVIPGGGVFVLGQEQDCLDGCFSSSQEFIGKLSQFNVYNYAMTHRQVASLFLNCLENKGNVKAWPDALSAQIPPIFISRPATFCRSCEPIPSVNHLSVKNQSEVVVGVSCEPGYNLKRNFGRRTMLHRRPIVLRCGNTGQWRIRGVDIKRPTDVVFCERKKCSRFAKIPHASIEATGSAFSDSVTYTCDEGYKRTGAETITCQADQTWTAPPPSCTDINECNRSPCHAMASCTNSEGSFQCVCNVGYTGDGFECALIDCGAPADVPHGIVTGERHNLDDVVHFSCVKGYELVGQEERTCLEDGQWSGTNPVCNIISCGQPENIEHASIDVTSSDYLGEALYTCDPGHEILGSAKRICLDTKQWSLEKPSCLPVQCPYPPAVAHAVFTPSQDLYHFEDLIYFTCDPGYQLVENNVLRCGEEATWQGVEPVCEPKSCGPPQNISNGFYEGEDFTFEHTVQYACNEGYNLNGTDVLLCLDSAEWSSDPPMCDPVPCGPVVPVANGHTDITGNVYLDTATFSCGVGYYMVGSDVLECLSTGQWGDHTTGLPASPPLCLPEPCGPPNDVSNSFYVLRGADDFVYGSHVTFSCNEGYYPSGKETLFCMSDGQWNQSGEAFRCNPVPCPQPDALKNGRIDGRKEPASSYTYLQSIAYTCDDGFLLVGSDSSFCQSNRQWSQSPPVCDPVHCGEPPEVSDAVVSLKHGPHKPGPHFQSRITYSCHEGFQLSHGNNDTRMCGSDAKWTGSAPMCERVPCGVPPSVQHGSRAPSDLMVFGDTTVYSCDVGFEASGSTTVTCTSTGQFTTVPSCDAIPCGAPPDVAYSAMTVDHPHAVHAFGSQITYQCEADFQMSGSATIECLHTGSWSSPPPSCTAITCESPGDLKNGFTFLALTDDVKHPDLYGTNSVSPRSAAISVCDDGYQLVDSVSLRSARLVEGATGEMKKGVILSQLSGSGLGMAQKAKLKAALDIHFNDKQSTKASNLPAPGALRSSNMAPRPLDLRTCTHGGAWLRSAPACESMPCAAPPTLSNGKVVPDTPLESFVFESQVQYRCDEGFYFGDGGQVENGTATITCDWMPASSTVGWTVLPRCFPVPCPEPMVAEHNSYSPTNKSFVFGDSITYSCDVGYDLVGENIASCNSQGEWSHEPSLCMPVECPHIRHLQNGESIFTSNTYQSTAVFNCLPGYDLHGSEKIVCQADRHWSAVMPTCDPVPCGTPAPVPHGLVSADSEVFMGEATYTCDSGFYLNGTDVAMCLETGEWFPEPPHCHRLRCSEPQALDHVTFTVESLPEVGDIATLSEAEYHGLLYVYETTINYACQSGYETFDTQSLHATCTEFQLWSRDSPVCVPKDCGTPPHADANGYKEGEDTTYGSVVSYICNIGYYTVAQMVSIYCTENGTWSANTLPPCLPRDCGIPEDPANGFHSGDLYTFPHAINYTCAQGYNLHGAHDAFCEYTGLWSNAPPFCDPVDCGVPGDVANGILNVENTVFGSMANYLCLPGYEIHGIEDLLCTWTGSWDRYPPECLPVDCGQPPEVANGVTIGSSHVFKSVVYFACDPGYEMYGPENDTCMEDGMWFDFAPDCLPLDCHSPPDVPNALKHWNGVSTLYKSLVAYECISGFELADTNVHSTQCQTDGTWSVPPECIRVTCGSPSSPVHGSIVEPYGPIFRYEDIVAYQCHKGYILSGSTEAVCSADRMWSNPPPSCDPVNCGRLPDIAHGRKHGEDTLFKALVRFECDVGYEPFGDVNLTCLFDGSWSSEVPRCPPVSCGEPPSVLFGVTLGGSSPENQVYESLVAFKCDEGYYLSGPVSAVCTANRLWQFGDNSGPGGATADNKPRCRKISCETPVAVDNAFFENKTYLYGDEVTYECNPGYDLVPLSNKFHCTANEGDVLGFYSGTPPVCKPVSCGVPTTVENGLFVSRGTTFLKTASYKCNDGHYATGVTEVVCQANRTWSGFPKCSPHDCGEPRFVANARVNVTSTLFETVLRYQCNVGYNLHGPGTTECLASANWSSVGGWSCDPVPCGDPPTVANATHIATGFVFGDSVMYRCDDGFTNSASNSGLSTLHCQSNGQWNDVDFACEPVPCGAAPVVPNGNAVVAVAHWPQSRLNSLIYPDIIEYTCNPGYYLEGNPRLSCTERGVLSSPPPSCPPVLCGVPDDIPNSVLSYSGVTFGHEATHSCNVGHVLRSDSQERTSHLLRCTEWETWEPVPPVEGCLPVHCPQPGHVKHATISTPKREQNKYRDSVKYKCDPGYEAPEDTLTIICQADKSWSQSPMCSPVSCGEPTCPSLSSCSKSGTTFGHNFSASCVPGYEFVRDVTSFHVTCNADRQWGVPMFAVGNVDLTTCRRHSCGQPRATRNGRFVLNDARVTYDATVTYICDPGFELSPGAVDTLTCTSNRNWGHAPVPTCNPKDCGPMTCPEHASCMSDGTTFTSTFTVRCDEGHELQYDVFSTSVTCLNTGKWSSLPYSMTCSPVRCSSPARIANGKLMSWNGQKVPVYRTTLRYECDLGHYMIGQAEITCQADRSYSSQAPDCSPVSCGDPASVRNGVTDYKATTYQESLHYSCLPGYDLLGNGNWVCSHNKQWIPSDPSAEHPPISVTPLRRRRSLPGSSDNDASGSGFFSEPSHSADSDFSAPDALMLRSFQPSTVLLSEEATAHTLPTCEPSPCRSLPDLKHGMPINSTETFVFGDSVAFICDNGFYLSGASVLKCLEDGNFGPPRMPTCERESCGAPPMVEHASFDTVSVAGSLALYVFEDVVTYTCDVGYEYQSTTPVNVITCAEDGNWTLAKPDPCPPVSCGNPPTSDHVIVSGNDYTYGEVVTYTCESGYNVVGQTELTCTSRKKWSPASAPTCSPVSCGRPEKIAHGLYTNEQSDDKLAFTFQRTATYSCESGYELNINPAQKATLTCLATGMWDALAPLCRPVSCGPPSSITNGHYTGTVFTYGQEVSYACALGHEMTGDPVLVCGADRQWSSPTPSCTPVTCDRPPHVEHSQHTLSPALTYGNSVSYQCDPGYYRIGHQTLTCTAFRIYDLPPPVCAPVSCGKPTPPEHAHVVEVSGAVTFGHNVTYQCDNGYNMRSGKEQQSVTCTAQATWSDTFPVCDIVTCGPVTSPEHGSVGVTSETYLSQAHFACDPGYELRSDGPTNNCDAATTCYICQAVGSWGYGNGSRAQPIRCEPLSCGEPTALVNGRAHADSHLFQSTVTYNCDPGYELFPPSTSQLRCQANYRWGPETPPVCRRAACATPVATPHGQFEITKHAPILTGTRGGERAYLYEDVVQYKCDSGYRLAAPHEGAPPHTGLLLCLATSQWDQAAPVCEPVPCGLAPPRKFGYVSNGESTKTFVFGEVARYSCDVGYEWTGEASEEELACSATGQWSPSRAPACEPVSCGSDPIVTNGKIQNAVGGTPQRRVFKSKVTYRCLEGYFMTGKDTVECTASRLWSNDPPTCSPAPCPPLPNVQFAHPVSKPPAPAPLLRMAVMDSFSGSGDLPETEPQSEEKEPVPPHEESEPITARRVVRRSATSRSYVFGDVVSFACDTGYRLNSTSVDFLRCGSGGEWLAPLPVCEPVPCDPLPEIPNARRVGNKFTFGEQVSFECDQGYESDVRDVNIFTCNAGGNFQVWSDDTMSTAPPRKLQMPTCARVSCGEAPVVNNAHIVSGSVQDYVFEDTLTYNCNDGYNLRGHSILTCQSNKSFDHERPACEPVSCGQPPELPNTNREVSSTVFEGTATYTCHHGYVQQTETITCQADGRWSPSNMVCERVSCGIPPPLTYGFVDINDTRYGDHAIYNCHPGYLMSGSTERVCLPSGNWSEACPVCAPIDCGLPDDPRNGYHVAKENYTFGEVVLYYCNEGYVPTGELFAMCMAGGSWSKSPPLCSRRSCGSTPAGTAASPIHPPTEHFFGDKVTYLCDYGHEFSTADSIICTSNGTFNLSPPVCTPVKCPSPPNIPNAQVVPGPREYMVYREQAEYQCVVGHVLNGSRSSLNCTGSGTFSEPEFSCVRVRCPTLPRIDRGSLSRRTGVFEDVVEYSCVDGFLLRGPVQRVCGPDASWSGNAPTCQPVSCGSAPLVEHGRVVDELSDYTYGMLAAYACSKGYELEHLNGGVKKCNADGSFSDGKITCVPVDCGRFVPNAHAIVNLKETTYTSSAKITCQDGYSLSTGQDMVNLVCQANRAWSIDPSNVTCLPVPCDPLPPVDHSSHTVIRAMESNGLNGNAQRGSTFGDRVVYRCLDGYFITGSSELTCRSNGTWSSLTPTCQPVVCGNAPPIENAHVAEATFTFGMVASYECDLGHEVSGDSMTLTCMADGNFEDSYVACTPKSCGKSPFVKNGMASAPSAVYGEFVGYTCSKGYELIGNNSLVCGSSGQWTSSPPSCSRVQCAALPDVPNSQSTLIGTRYGDAGSLTCKEGFKISTKETAIEFECMADGSWSRDLSEITCDPVACEMIQGILNGDMTVIPRLEALGTSSHSTHTGSSHTYGTKLSFSCDSGYYLSGSDLIICQANRLWSGPPPSCLPVQCDNPPSLPNARLTTDSHTFGSKALYECVEGHNLTSSGNFRLCKADGNFSRHEVTCSPVPCTELPTVKHGRVVSVSGARPVYGALADTVCDEGYTLMGAGEFECLSDGQWSQAEPTCQPNVCGFPPTVRNASPKAGLEIEYAYGDTVIYECNKGYTLSGKANSLACEASGLFSNATITCNPVSCPSITPPAHATVGGSSASYRSEVKITCVSGYEVAGRNGASQVSLICQHDRHWSEEPEQISCVGVACDPFKPFTNGNIDMSFARNRYESGRSLVTYPSTVIYKCDSGYTLVGRSKRQCRHDGTWTGNSPVCQPVNCGVLPRFVHGTINSNKTTTLGSVAIYECDVGYSLYPPDATRRRCMETGSWSGVPPRCNMVTCIVPSKIDHGSVSLSPLVSYGTSVTYTCDVGYKLSGSYSRTCQADGQLDGQDASCNPVSCGAHPDVANGDVQPSGEILYGDVVNITCKKGQLYGSETRLCQSNGNFSGDVPVCEHLEVDLLMDMLPDDGEMAEPVSCGPPNLQGTKAKLVQPLDPFAPIYEGRTITLRCKHGYAPEGDIVATCVEGSWVNIPQCIPKCRHRCLHKGSCSSQGSCSCVNGWAGSRCQRPVCILPCLNGGYCSAAFTCRCAEGWSGERCQEPTCHQLCLNGGTCVAPNLCHCPYGYQGDDCSQSSSFFFW